MDGQELFWNCLLPCEYLRPSSIHSASDTISECNSEQFNILKNFLWNFEACACVFHDNNAVTKLAKSRAVFLFFTIALPLKVYILYMLEKQMRLDCLLYKKTGCWLFTHWEWSFYKLRKMTYILLMCLKTTGQTFSFNKNEVHVVANKTYMDDATCSIS